MNILWIEDFGGTLSSGTETLELMFQGLLSFDEWDEDELNLIKKPADLVGFCQDQGSVHRIYLCRHYFDYLEFKAKYSILNEIDVIITDIRLDNLEPRVLDLAIPEPYTDKSKFHINGGFYIFNDLIHLGVPAERMCFMSGEKNSFKAFEEKCSEIYIPKVKAFEKSDADYEKLRDWIDVQGSDYAMLRRGIIEGCHQLKLIIGQDEQAIQFRDFIKEADHEIASTDIHNYLDTLALFLPIKEESEQSNMQYRLFLRALAHEWEEKLDPQSLKQKYGNDLNHIHDIYTFAWLMKMTRNWVSHANLLEPLNPQIIAFLFMVNMRAMFALLKQIQPYEEILLSCINKNPEKTINLDSLRNEIKYANEDIDNILRVDDATHFGSKMNDLYRQNTGNPDAEEHDFKHFLLQYFWLNQKNYLHNLIPDSNEFLPTLARHIHSHSFPAN